MIQNDNKLLYFIGLEKINYAMGELFCALYSHDVQNAVLQTLKNGFMGENKDKVKNEMFLKLFVDQMFVILFVTNYCLNRCILNLFRVVLKKKPTLKGKVKSS